MRRVESFLLSLCTSFLSHTQSVNLVSSPLPGSLPSPSELWAVDRPLPLSLSLLLSPSLSLSLSVHEGWNVAGEGRGMGLYLERTDPPSIPAAPKSCPRTAGKCLLPSLLEAMWSELKTKLLSRETQGKSLLVIAEGVPFPLPQPDLGPNSPPHLTRPAVHSPGFGTRITQSSCPLLPARAT